MTNENKKINFIWYTLSFFIPIILVLLACFFLGIYPFGNKTYGLWDADIQFTPYLGYFKSIFTSNTDFIYSLAKEGGNGMFDFNACYINNPLNFIAFLFPNNRLDFAFEVITLIKIGLVGLSLSWFLNHDKPFDKKSLIFSCGYALSTCALYYSQSIMGFEGMYLLPAALVGIDKITAQQKPMIFIGFTAAALLLEPYAGYIVLLFSFLYLLYSLSLDNKGWKRVLGTYFLSVAGIISLSMIITLPTLFALQGTKYHISCMLKLLLFNPLDIVPFLYTGTRFPNLFFDSPYPYIYVGILPLIFVISYFLNNGIKLKERLFTGLFLCFMVLSLAWHPLFSLFNGGNAMPVGCMYRYVYIFLFLFCYIGYKGFDKFDAQNKLSVFLLGLIFVGTTLWVHHLPFAYISKTLVAFDCILGLFFIICLYLAKMTSKQSWIIFLIMFLGFGELCLNAYMVFGCQDENRLSTPTEFRTTYDNMSNILNAIKTNDKGFYRIETEETLVKGKSWIDGHWNNNALMYNYNAISHYSSLGSVNLRNFYAKMGFDILKFNNLVAYSDNMPLFAPSFMGIKYIISDKKEHINPYVLLMSSDKPKPLYVYENPFALPVGFISENDILNLEIGDKHVFGLYNILPKYILGEDLGDIYKIFEFDEVNYSPSTQLSDAKFIVTTDEQLWFSQDIFGAKAFEYFTVNSEQRRIGKSLLSFSVEHLGKYNPGDEIKIIMYKNQDLHIHLLPKFYYASQNAELLKQYFDLIKKRSCDLEVITSSHLKGHFTTEKDNQVLFLTIPFDENWEIIIDGKKVNQQRVVEAMTGVLIKNQGEHTLEMKYKIKLLPFSALISLLTLLLMIFYFLKREKNENEL